MAPGQYLQKVGVVSATTYLKCIYKFPNHYLSILLRDKSINFPPFKYILVQK